MERGWGGVKWDHMGNTIIMVRVVMHSYNDVFAANNVIVTYSKVMNSILVLSCMGTLLVARINLI